MASKHNSSLSAFVFLMVLLGTTQLIDAARRVPTDANNKDVPITTQNIPGFGGHIPHKPKFHAGGYGIGVPGSEYHQYIPGLDDGIVQNPGFEIPYPHAGHHAAASAP